MRVALDVSAVPAKVAGAGRYVAELARRLPERAIATTLITRRGDTQRWCELSPRARVVGAVPGSRVARLANEALFLGRGTVARSNDLWHAPHYTMPRRGVTPTVVTIHDLTFFTNPEWHERSKVAFFRRAITYSARHARVLVSVSDYTARLVEELLPTHAPIVVAPLGVDLETFQPHSRDDEAIFARNELPHDVPFVLFVGTLEPRKGLEVLLEAFSEIARQDERVELWLVGQAGWGVGPLRSQLNEHPSSSRIRQLGYVDETFLPALYRRSRVVAYPSRGEGFGLPVLEAMACGAPVVTTEATVMAEVAGDGARLVPVGDARALAQAIVDVLGDDEVERATEASRARARAEFFTWDHCVDQHLAAYDLALGSS